MLFLSTEIDSSAEQNAKHPAPSLVTDSGMLMEVNDSQYWKQLSPKLVTLYETPSYVTFAGIVTSVAEPLYCASSAVLFSVSRLYLNPSSELYSMTSAFIVMLMAAKRAMSMNLKVKSFLIARCVLPTAPS